MPITAAFMILPLIEPVPQTCDGPTKHANACARLMGEEESSRMQ
jgi:hypothetical protein